MSWMAMCKNDPWWQFPKNTYQKINVEFALFTLSCGDWIWEEIMINIRWPMKGNKKSSWVESTLHQLISASGILRYWVLCFIQQLLHQHQHQQASVKQWRHIHPPGSYHSSVESFTITFAIICPLQHLYLGELKLPVICRNSLN